MRFRALVAGGTGQVGSGLVRALLASSCTQVMMVNRRTIHLAADARLRQVIMGTSAANFAGEIAEVARKCSAQGEPLPHHVLASAKGVSNGAKRTSGSWKWEWSARLRVGALAVGIEVNFLHGQDGTTILENTAMKQRSRAH